MSKRTRETCRAYFWIGNSLESLSPICLTFLLKRCCTFNEGGFHFDWTSFRIRDMIQARRSKMTSAN